MAGMRAPARSPFPFAGTTDVGTSKFAMCRLHAPRCCDIRIANPSLPKANVIMSTPAFFLIVKDSH